MRRRRGGWPGRGRRRDSDADADSDSDLPTPCAPEVEIVSIDRVLDPKLAGEPGTDISLDLRETGNPPDATHHLAVEVTGASGGITTLVEEDTSLGPGRSNGTDGTRSASPWIPARTTSAAPAAGGSWGSTPGVSVFVACASGWGS